MIGRYSGRRKERYWELDFLRGLCVLLMMFDHFMYCLWDIVPFINEVLGTAFLADMRKVAIEYWNWTLRNNVREVVILCFLLLCGVSCTLTRGNFRRFIPLALVAAGLSAVTSVLDTFMGGEGDVVIVFGVIHMIAGGILLYALIDNAAVAVGDALCRGKPRVRLALRLLPGLFGAALLICYFCMWGKLFIGNGRWNFMSQFPAPEGLTEQEFVFLSVFLQFQGRGLTALYGGDYFPLLPYAAFILLGGIIGVLVYHTPARFIFSRLDGAWNRGFCFLGRHAAFLYIAHMVVIPAVLALFAWLSSLL